MDIRTMWEVVTPVPEHWLKEGDLILQWIEDGSLTTIVGNYRCYLGPLIPSLGDSVRSLDVPAAVEALLDTDTTQPHEGLEVDAIADSVLILEGLRLSMAWYIDSFQPGSTRRAEFARVAGEVKRLATELADIRQEEGGTP